MQHPFADLIGLSIESQINNGSVCSLTLNEQLLNPNRVAHGAVLYALADTGMGAALFPSLNEGQLCATIEIKMNYFRAVTEGKVVCETTMVNRGKTVANLESSLTCNGELIAKANGNFAIFTPTA